MVKPTRSAHKLHCQDIAGYEVFGKDGQRLQLQRLRKLKPKGSFITRPRSALSTRPSRPDRGLIGRASVAFLTGWRRRTA